jgi:hypothetical protein
VLLAALTLKRMRPKARLKDGAEGRLNRAVCAGRITLRYAQHPDPGPDHLGQCPMTLQDHSFDALATLVGR